MLAEAKRLCHASCAEGCVEVKRAGLHLKLLEMRPHWSVLKREEQERTIDRGETEPFDMAIPLPAKDRRDPAGGGIRRGPAGGRTYSGSGSDAPDAADAAIPLGRGSTSIGRTWSGSAATSAGR